MESKALSFDEKQTLEFLKQKPMKITDIGAMLNRDPSTVYKIARALERKQLVKIGYERVGSKVKVVALCYLPEQEKALKAGRYGMAYLPIQKVAEGKPKAEQGAVVEFIRKIDSAISSEIWHEGRSRVIELRQLFIHKRTYHVTELLDAIERYVNTQEFFENERTREDLAMIMWYVLHNEKDVGDVGATKKIIEKLTKPARKILLHDKKNGRHYALLFLSETEQKESVDAIIALISQHPTEITGNFEDGIHYALFNSELRKKQSQYIQEKLVELSSSKEEPVRCVTRRLQERPRVYS